MSASPSPTPDPIDARIDAAIAKTDTVDAALVVRMASREHVRAVAGAVAGVVLPVIDGLGKAAILAAAGPLVGGAANALLTAGEAGLTRYLAGHPAVPAPELAQAARAAGTAAASVLADQGHPDLGRAAEQALGSVASAVAA